MLIFSQLRASYRPYNHVDEIASIYSICFSSRGDELLAGSERVSFGLLRLAEVLLYRALVTDGLCLRHDEAGAYI